MFLTRRKFGVRAEVLLKQLKPQTDHPLHFTVEHNPGVQYMPYWQVEDQTFTCFPVIDVVLQET